MTGFWLYILNRQLYKNWFIPYTDDWQSVCGSPINSHFLTCADHHDLPPSVIVWVSGLSALHLLTSEAFCSEKGNCQQWLSKWERKQKEAGSEMCNFLSARLMGEERRRQGGERKGGGKEGQGEVESLWVRKNLKIKKSTQRLEDYFIFSFFLLNMYFSCICLI